jgi:hypothetical protein
VLIPAGVARQQGKIVTLAHGDVAFADLKQQFCKNVSAGKFAPCRAEEGWKTCRKQEGNRQTASF